MSGCMFLVPPLRSLMIFAGYMIQIKIQWHKMSSLNKGGQVTGFPAAKVLAYRNIMAVWRRKSLLFDPLYGKI